MDMKIGGGIVLAVLLGTVGYFVGKSRCHSGGHHKHHGGMYHGGMEGMHHMMGHPGGYGHHMGMHEMDY